MGQMGWCEGEELKQFAVLKEAEEHLVDFFNTYEDVDFLGKYLVKNKGLICLFSNY
ncbi:hypothetical protein M3629_11470 [Paenibacillus polysaccharolyticus]|uniref:hypothetical protein n=1 Tax=Paenibacillus polysaccharolyticus TaxID=582692 RepID=UPI0020424A65|nr:hypothetical protein [Paenibacillus polysaccharolyticus]MCM3133416.1 hypothetical protein [Paenibacillus polysaccharolyticus]